MYVFHYSCLKLGKEFWISFALVLNKCKLVFRLIQMTGFYLKQACLENEIPFSTYRFDLVVLGKWTHSAFVMRSHFNSSYKKTDVFCKTLHT